MWNIIWNAIQNLFPLLEQGLIHLIFVLWRIKKKYLETAHLFCKRKFGHSVHIEGGGMCEISAHVTGQKLFSKGRENWRNTYFKKGEKEKQ